MSDSFQLNFCHSQKGKKKYENILQTPLKRTKLEINHILKSR